MRASHVLSANCVRIPKEVLIAIGKPRRQPPGISHYVVSRQRLSAFILPFSPMFSRNPAHGLRSDRPAVSLKGGVNI
jgi:hypothetical protein